MFHVFWFHIIRCSLMLSWKRGCGGHREWSVTGERSVTCCCHQSFTSHFENIWCQVELFRTVRYSLLIFLLCVCSVWQMTSQFDSEDGDITVNQKVCGCVNIMWLCYGHPIGQDISSPVHCGDIFYVACDRLLIFLTHLSFVGTIQNMPIPGHGPPVGRSLGKSPGCK